MKNTLAIDIGNTNINMGLFRSGRLVKKTKMPTHAYSMYDRNLKALLKRCRAVSPSEEYTVMISSVVPIALSRLLNQLNRIAKCNIINLGRNLKVPIKNMYKIKHEVGQDRLVNAFAAKSLYGTPAVIIDFGTAITFDIVSRKGEYLGGLILPGIEMSLASLYEKTAMLPKVGLARATHIIGRDTVNSMRGGMLFGLGAMCDGLNAKYRKLLGKDTKVIATGGNAALIKKYTKSIQIVDELLTLKGLKLITGGVK